MVGVTIGTKPTCAALADAGKQIYVDDTDDILPGGMCQCNADAAGVYAWNRMDMVTACPP